MRIPLIDLAAQREVIGDRIQAAVSKVIDGGAYILGPEVRELEERLQHHSGVARVVTCASGTDALLLPLLAWGIGPGDAVYVPAFTFAATAEVVALLGATPVFVDVREDTFDIDPEALAVAIADTPSRLRPAGIIAVDLFGQPADYTALRGLSQEHGIWVLADAAQSFGACLEGRDVGGLATATATSFFPSKPLGCYGDGGAVFTDDEELAATLRSLRVHGQGSDKYDNVRVGINGRLDTIQAAILLEKLHIFDDELVRRDAVARRYAPLSSVARLPVVRPSATSAWAQYTIRIENRDAIADGLRAAGIASAVYYRRGLHDQPAYVDRSVVSRPLTTTESLCRSVLSIPMHPYLAPSEQQEIVERIIAAAHR
jgi:dTDP-4-amino-4,6-dideoxygalactose transaminase